MNEIDYLQGSHTAWMQMLRECLRHLGYDNPETMKVGWVIEREAIVRTLRNLCSDFGDNDWPEKLNLSDVIEKHLARHLYTKAQVKQDDE